MITTKRPNKTARKIATPARMQVKVLLKIMQFYSMHRNDCHAVKMSAWNEPRATYTKNYRKNFWL